MPISARRFSGWLAQREGDGFENLFRAFCTRKGVQCLRIPNGARIVRTPRGLKAIPIRSPFDWVLGFNGQAALIDSKSTGERTFSYSSIVPHQLEALEMLAPHVAASGYVVYFRQSHKVIFMPTALLRSIGPRQGWNPERDLGGVELGHVSLLDPRRIFPPILSQK